MVSFPETASVVLFSQVPPVLLISKVYQSGTDLENQHPTTREHSVDFESCHLKWKTQK